MTVVRDWRGRPKPLDLDELPRIFKEDPEMICIQEVLAAYARLAALKNTGARNRAIQYIQERLDADDLDRADAARPIDQE
jgi:hypothetical protein